MSFTPLLSIIVPVYNELATVIELLDIVQASALDKEIIVVDDGSSDGSHEALQNWVTRHDDAILLHHDENRGKGAAIISGLAAATGKLVIVQDADLEYDPRDFVRLMAPILSGEADCVFGSRRLGESPKAAWNTWWNLRQWRNPFYHGVTFLNCLVWWWYSARITDEATCYKLFRTDDLQRMNLACQRFEFCPEVTAKAIRMGLRIKEIPIRYTPRSVKEGKKIKLKDALEAVRTLWKYRNWLPS